MPATVASMTSKIGQRIRQARERRRMTQEQLAEAVGVSLRSVGNWERGATVPLNRKAALEEVLGVDLDAEPVVHQLPATREGARALFVSYGADTPMEKIRVLQELMAEVLREQQEGGGGDGK